MAAPANTAPANAAAVTRKRRTRSVRRQVERGPAPVLDPPTLTALYRKLVQLRGAVAKEGAAIFGLWGKTLAGSDFVPAAENLAHYLALRRRDLSALQPALAAYGLSSLGRSEARVMITLDALVGTLARLAGLGAPPYPDPAALAAGAATLRHEQDRFFGRDPGGPYTRIMVTLPTDAGDGPALVRRLIEAGMNCARINCAHDDPAVWAAMIANVRAAAAGLGRHCSVLMDIAGPKCRVETVHLASDDRLHRGDRLVLVKGLGNAHKSDGTIATISFPDLLDLLEPDAEVWIDDGKIGAHVVSNESGRVLLEVFSARGKGVKLRAEKGVNFPHTELNLPTLGPADLKALDFIAANADLIGFSFVQHPADVALLDRELRARRPSDKAGLPPQPVVLKIETKAAVENLPQLIVATAATRPVAVMIARGDLGHAGARQFRRRRKPEPRGGHRCRHVPARRMRDAQQGTFPRRGYRLPQGHSAADGPSSIQEIRAIRLAQILEPARHDPAGIIEPPRLIPGRRQAGRGRSHVARAVTERNRTSVSPRNSPPTNAIATKRGQTTASPAPR
jgi:pyruvate kinase